MIPHETLEEYARYAGDSDYASYAKVDTRYWNEIDRLLMHLQIVEGGYAADSFRADFANQLKMAGVSLETLSGLKKLIDSANAKRRKKT